MIIGCRGRRLALLMGLMGLMVFVLSASDSAASNVAEPGSVRLDPPGSQAYVQSDSWNTAQGPRRIASTSAGELAVLDGRSAVQRLALQDGHVMSSTPANGLSDAGW